MKGNKAQGLSLTTIIIAILVIIVLVVVVLIFTGRMGFFGRSLDTCDGDCAATAKDCRDQYDAIPVPVSKCNGDEALKYCCVATT